MVAYVTRVPAGFPGAITRKDSLTVEPEVNDSSTPVTAFGSFVKLVSGKVQPLAASDTSSVIWGLAVRPFPVQSTTNAFGAATIPSTQYMLDVMRRGFVAVTLKQGTAAKGGTVYVCTTAGSGLSVGDITTAANAGACVATSAVFMGPADANGVVEIALNI